MFLVHAPSRLTTLRCCPRCTMILSSSASALMCAGSACRLTILTATVVTDSRSPKIPLASAFITTPKAPAPSCLPDKTNLHINARCNLVEVFFFNTKLDFLLWDFPLPVVGQQLGLLVDAQFGVDALDGARLELMQTSPRQLVSQFLLITWGYFVCWLILVLRHTLSFCILTSSISSRKIDKQASITINAISPAPNFFPATHC